MAASNIKEEEQISAVREFNRFYTARLGLLRKRHLDGDFSLTEARILYEIGASPRLTASSLRNTLGLNAGYVSRSLALLTKRKLVRQTPSRHTAWCTTGRHCSMQPEHARWGAALHRSTPRERKPRLGRPGARVVSVLHAPPCRFSPAAT